jgi:hypothetical protein
MKGLFSTAYFGPVSYYQKLFLSADKRLLEINEFFEKQSYRNRAVILGANGRMNLIIPLEKQIRNTLIKDRRIDHRESWQSQHLKGIISAYRSSPYFEFYEEDFMKLFEKKDEFLLDFNLRCHDFIASELEEDLSFEKTTAFVEDFDGEVFKNTIHPKKESLLEEVPYYQVFEEKHGFQSDLSILDLLFSQGPNAISYLY